MTAKSSSARIGRASANSVRDWPRSDVTWIVRLLRFFTGSSCRSKGWAPSGEGAPCRRSWCCLRQNAGDVLDRVAYAGRKQRDRTDDGEGDDGEHDSVLRHRLTLLTPAQRVGGDLHEGEELQHLIHLLSQLDAHISACALA